MDQTTDIQALFVIEPLQQSTGSEIQPGGGATCSNCNCNSNSNGSSEELLA
jgi:hypothetical protein